MIIKPDDKFQYMILGRMQQDCEYFIFTLPCKKHLYMGNVLDQISEMKRIWSAMVEKPEWLSFEDILNYETKMLEIEG